MTYAELLEKSRNRICALLAKPGMNKVLLANKAGVHRNTLIGVEQANWNPTGGTLDAIMAAVPLLEKVTTPPEGKTDERDQRNG